MTLFSHKKRKTKKKRGNDKPSFITKFLDKSPINYFSDLFVVSMVLIWAAVCTVMAVMAVYSTVINQDNAIWSDLGVLVAVPLSAGGAIWMIKNSIGHAIFNNKGEIAPEDFPNPLEDSQYTDFEIKEKKDGETQAETV